MNEEQKKILEQEYRKDKLKKVANISAVVIAFVAFAVMILMGRSYP